MDPPLASGSEDTQDLVDSTCRPALWQNISWPPPVVLEHVPASLSGISSSKAGASQTKAEDMAPESESHNNDSKLSAGQTCAEQSVNSRTTISLQNRSHSMPEVEKQSTSITIAKSGTVRQALRLPSFKSLGIANPQPNSLLTPPDEAVADPLIASVLNQPTPGNSQYVLTTAELSPADSPLHDSIERPFVTPTLSNRHSRPPHIELSGPSDEPMHAEQPPSTSSSSATESIGGRGWYDQTVETISGLAIYFRTD